jgi:hypothetical protein
MATTEHCVICGRLLGTINISKHHLIPKTFDKSSPTIVIHNICHSKIHASMSERELQHYYHTVDRLLEHADMMKFVEWVKNKPTSYYDTNNETKSRYRKRRK